MSEKGKRESERVRVKFCCCSSLRLSLNHALSSTLNVQWGTHKVFEMWRMRRIAEPDQKGFTYTNLEKSVLSSVSASFFLLQILFGSKPFFLNPIWTSFGQEFTITDKVFLFIWLKSCLYKSTIFQPLLWFQKSIHWKRRAVCDGHNWEIKLKRIKNYAAD